MSDVNLGKISIPVIAPQKGVDYWTEADKQEVINEAVNSVSTIVGEQEDVRQSNETTRLLNEEERRSAEVTRQSNEQIRINNENTRQESENTRQLNEQARINNEAVRQLNEQTRQNNETNRTNTFNEQISSIDRAIEGILQGVIVAPTEPTGNNRNRVWFQKGTNEDSSIYLKNDSNVYEKFVDVTQIENNLKQKVYHFNTIQDMKNCLTLIPGDVVQTLGYYETDDGGGALYKIRNYTINDVIDNAFIIQLTENLVAELIIEKNVVSIRQLGAKSQDKENNKYDIKPFIEKYINYIANSENRCRLYIPSGLWYSSPLEITNPNGFDIFGDFGYYMYGLDSTVITSLNDNQPYILKIGTNTGTYLKNWNLENILFSTFDYEWRENNKNFYISTPKKVSNSVVQMVYAIHGKMDNVLFINVIGQALKIAGCWENIFGYLVFRYVSNPTGSILCFDKDTTYGQYAGISASDFSRLYFECTHGDLIEFKGSCNFANVHFGIINFEPGEMNYNNEFTYSTIEHDGSNIPSNLKHYYILKLSQSGSNIEGVKIESIELNGFSQKMFSYNGNTYTYDSILFTPSGSVYLGLLIDTINSTETRKDIILYKNTSDNVPSVESYLIINTVALYSSHDFVFDLKNAFSNIKCGGILTGSNKLVTKLNNNITPFIDVLSPIQAKIIASDKDSINPLKLCPILVRYDGTIWNGKFINTGTKLKIRAKIPNGETYTFRLRNEAKDHTENLTMLGTGNFTWYDLQLSQYFQNFGEIYDFKSGAGSNPDNVLLDCFIFTD